MDAEPLLPWTSALAIDAGLLSLFAVQHSVMARKGFKRIITRVIPHAAERSTYVAASSIALALLFYCWQPLGGTIWSIQSAPGQFIMYFAYSFGWALVLLATFVINHFDLFGLRQVWRELQGQRQEGLRFAVPLLYSIVRHPLYVGWLFVFWSTPEMTVTHLFFAVMTTGYILVAIQFEERDLQHDHPEYVTYRKQVPMLIPRLTRRGRAFDTPPVSSNRTVSVR
jgi:protein-S-isoprenylcysteine O-methyltransferase Ste14